MTTKPVESGTHDRGLAELRRRSRGRSRSTSAAVRSVGAISTSFMAVAGLKKWRPMKRSGRLVATAISVMPSVEVLLAKIASGSRRCRRAARRRRAWSGRSSTIDSITMSHAAEVVRARSSSSGCPSAPSASLALQAALLDLLARRRPSIFLRAPSIEPGRHLDQDGLEARRGRRPARCRGPSGRHRGCPRSDGRLAHRVRSLRSGMRTGGATSLPLRVWRTGRRSWRQPRKSRGNASFRRRAIGASVAGDRRSATPAAEADLLERRP